jgi:hypothetical protein
VSLLKAFALAGIVALVSLSTPRSVLAQGSAPVAAAKPLVLVPYEEPDTTDPHAIAITQTLEADLAAAGIVVKRIAPVDHLEAVSDAAKICADNGASGILVPEGRYEQTRKAIPAPFVTVLRYPTHVEFRLDEIDCAGAVRWSTTTTGDETPTGAYSVGNLGAAVDAAFRTAVQAAATARGSSHVAPLPASGARTLSSTLGLPAAPSSYLLVPFEQPGIADPRGADITHSLLVRLQENKRNVTVGMPIDHLTTPAGAQKLCAASGSQAIIVPDVRVEQSSATSRSHASLRLTLLNCNGAVVRHGSAEADIGQVGIVNFGAGAVAVTEKAMGPAIDQLFPDGNAK